MSKLNIGVVNRESSKKELDGVLKKLTFTPSKSTLLQAMIKNICHNRKEICFGCKGVECSDCILASHYYSTDGSDDQRMLDVISSFDIKVE